MAKKRVKKARKQAKKPAAKKAMVSLPAKKTPLLAESPVFHRNPKVDLIILVAIIAIIALVIMFMKFPR